jgi:hypothetical protein
MPRPNPPLLEYNKKNLRSVSKSIERNLTPDLLPKKWIEINANNKMFGHCHNASGCLYKIFGSQNLHLYRALDRQGVWHWWVQDKNDLIIDLTRSQYSETAVRQLHRRGEKAGLLGFHYKKNVMTVLNRVRKDLQL